jgi:glycosyltransferase involved in cell wall biosynthesis
MVEKQDDMNDKGLLTVIIPAYNEAQSLPAFLPELIAYCRDRSWRIVVVNDGSVDGTAEILERFAGNEQFTVIRHKLNKGYGAALKTGLLACETPYAVTIDADGQHYPEDIDKLFAMLMTHDADLVVGSRKDISKGSTYRGVGKSIIRNLAKVLMTVPVYDLNSGMKVYNTSLVLRYLHLAPDTMAFSDIITLVFINNRHLVLEEPIRIRKRKFGNSTIGLQTAFQTIMEILNIVILFNPMKIFLPFSLMSFFITGLWGVPLLLQGRGLSIGSLLGVVLGILLFLLGLIAEQLSQIRRNQRL